MCGPKERRRVLTNYRGPIDVAPCIGKQENCRIVDFLCRRHSAEGYTFGRVCQVSELRKTLHTLCSSNCSGRENI